MITDRGLTLAGKSFQDQARALDEPTQLPHWDANRRKLIYGRIVVIQLPCAAPNLECALAAFEKRDWPGTMIDPFPPDPEGGALQRVRDTVYALNQRRSAPLIEFFSQTSGPRIGWQVPTLTRR